MSVAGSPGNNGAAPQLCPPPSPVEITELLPRRAVPYRGHAGPATRRKREMTPANRKDAVYWDRRRKNNEAARRSREKRRLNDLLLEGQMLAVSEENAHLRAQMLELQQHVLAPSRALPHGPNLFHPGLWAPPGRGSNLEMMRQEPGTQHLDAKIPHLGSNLGYGVFNPHPKCVTQPGSGPLSGGPVEAEGAPQRPVSDPPASSLPTYLPTLDAFPSAPYPPQNWLLPPLSHPALCNPLLPWGGGPYLPTGRPDRDQSSQRESKSRFSCPAP
ncbi:uncharacterized protein ACNS7B_003914 [Menidia menidia]